MDKAEIKIKYFVCDAPGSTELSDAITDKMLFDQTKTSNRHYAGGASCSSESYQTQRAKTKISFKQIGIERVQHKGCRGDCTDHDNEKALRTEVVPQERGMVKILLCKMQYLGMASLPTQYSPANRILFIAPGTVPGGASPKYNLGGTLTHEMGHYLGLHHPFQGGCEGGDDVSDTPAEEEAHYGCQLGRKTCGTIDPIHNFMDYSDDACMCSFTKGQTELMWKYMKTTNSDLLSNGPNPQPNPGPNPAPNPEPEPGPEPEPNPEPNPEPEPAPQPAPQSEWHVYVGSSKNNIKCVNDHEALSCKAVGAEGDYGVHVSDKTGYVCVYTLADGGWEEDLVLECAGPVAPPAPEPPEPAYW